MLPFFRKAKPVVELLTFDHGVVGFRCEQPLVVGQRLQAQCRLPDGGQEFEATLLVQHVGDPSRGVIEKPAETNQHLSVLLPPAFTERREEARVGKALRVQSREVVGYKCTTTDVSSLGMGLLLDGPAQVGDRLKLEIDADIPDSRGVSFFVEVLWALPEDANRKYRVGTRYLGLTPHQIRMLDRILAYITQLKG